MTACMLYNDINKLAVVSISEVIRQGSSLIWGGGGMRGYLNLLWSVLWCMPRICGKKYGKSPRLVCSQMAFKLKTVWVATSQTPGLLELFQGSQNIVLSVDKGYQICVFRTISMCDWSAVDTDRGVMLSTDTRCCRHSPHGLYLWPGECRFGVLSECFLFGQLSLLLQCCFSIRLIILIHEDGMWVPQWLD